MGNLRRLHSVLLTWLLFFVQAGLASELSPVSATELRFPLRTPLDLEHARTPDEIAWGLMQRPSLPADSGMLFHYVRPQNLSFWSFNCLIDLDVAYLDGGKVIREIHKLKAFPEKMDPKRPVNSVRDFQLYSAFESSIRFYQKHAVGSRHPSQFVLEMNAGWFARRTVAPGDLLYAEKEIVHTLDVSELKLPVTIQFPTKGPWTLWQPKGKRSLQVVERNAAGHEVQTQQLPVSSRSKLPLVIVTAAETTQLSISVTGLP